jgi:hypothetical protein
MWGCTGADISGWPSFNIWWFSQIPQGRWDAALEDDTGSCLTISMLARRSRVVGSWGRQAAKIWITKRGMSLALFSWDKFKTKFEIVCSEIFFIWCVSWFWSYGQMVWPVSNTWNDHSIFCLITTKWKLPSILNSNQLYRFFWLTSKYPHLNQVIKGLFSVIQFLS